MNEPKRKRSPWYAFYPDDFDGGTSDMSLAAVGAFVRLLNYQFANSRICDPTCDPTCDRKLCRIVRATGSEWEEIREEVLSKFVSDGEGGLINLRMAKERDERASIREKRVSASKVGNEKRWQNDPKCDPKCDNSAIATTTTTTTYTNREREKGPDRPSLDQAKSAGPQAGVTEQEAEEWWHKREATGWMRSLGGSAVAPVGKAWRSDMKQWANHERERKAEAEARKNRTNVHKAPDEPQSSPEGFWHDGSETVVQSRAMANGKDDLR